MTIAATLVPVRLPAEADVGTDARIGDRERCLNRDMTALPHSARVRDGARPSSSPHAASRREGTLPTPPIALQQTSPPLCTVQYTGVALSLKPDWEANSARACRANGLWSGRHRRREQTARSDAASLLPAARGDTAGVRSGLRPHDRDDGVAASCDVTGPGRRVAARDRRSPFEPKAPMRSWRHPPFRRFGSSSASHADGVRRRGERGDANNDEHLDGSR
jgi:hypothetical protein